jgi:DNA repair protein endonuclease SAE2/CtIP C-terminus
VAKSEYDALSRKYNTLAAAHQALLTKYRTEKKTIRAWASYLKKQKRDERQSRRTTSTNPSDDETARSVFRAGASMRPSCDGALNSVLPEASVSPLPELASGSQNGSTMIPCPTLAINTPTPIDTSRSTSRLDALTPPPGRRSKAGAERECSPTDAPPDSSRSCVDSSPSSIQSNPNVSHRQKHSRAETQYTSKAHVSSYDEAETTDEDRELHNVTPSPSTTTLATTSKGVHSGSKAVPEGQESSPRMPIIPSERASKRKKALHYGSVTKPIRIKSEHGSSSPIGLAGFREVPESLDLDEVGEKIDTPRKRKRVRHFPQEFQSYTNPQLDGLDEDLPECPFQPSSEGARKVKDDCSNTRTHGRSNHHLNKPGGGGDGTQCKEEISHIEEAAPLAVSEVNGVDVFQKCLIPERTPGTSALQPSGTNIGLSCHMRGNKSRDYRTRSEERIESAVASAHFLAEDGESISSGSRLPPTGNRTSDERELRRKRLIDLLERQSPNKTMLSPSKHMSKNTRQSTRRDASCDEQLRSDATTPRGELNSRQPHTATTKRDRIQPSEELKTREKEGRDLKKEGSSSPPQRSIRTYSKKRVQRSEPSDLGTPRDHRRLRDRPLHQLTLEDFKINPDYAKGSDFAFAETVRNQDQRRCLPGCTRQECCGLTFRKAIELGGIPTPASSKSRIFWNSSQEQGDEEQQLLEDYVGDDRVRLHKLTPEERCELVTQARIKQFADKHGRHRQAFERRATPPGFWRTDMPTSQELEQDREEARKKEREQVEERYREAKRGKGKWVFRDE